MREKVSDGTRRRRVLAVATLATAGALALAPIAVAPPELHAPSIAAARISTQAVQLTDAWSDLLNDTLGSVVQLGGLFIGANSTFPLPNPTIPLAPVATQLVLNQLIYLGQLFTGQGAQIPGEIATPLTNVFNLAKGLVGDLPPAIVQQIQTPFVAAKLAIDSITTSGNLLIGLLEAPAVFLNFALNSQYGLLGVTGPIAVPIIVRNLLAVAVDPPLPAWLSNILQPGKAPSAAALRATPAAAATVTLKVAPPSHTAGSARSASNKPAAASSRKAASAKANSNNAGQGHSKRG
jgi:hypothetical protein